jgi:outer membrane protein TolC
MKLRIASVLVVAALSGAGSGSAHEPASTVIDREEAERLGALRGPGVPLAEAPRAGVVEAGDATMSFARPPIATLSAGYRGGAIAPGPEVVATVMQEIPLRSVGGARREVAGALRDAVNSDVARARLDGAARGALAWVGAVEAGEIARLRRDALTQAEALVDTTHKRVDAGAALPFERALSDAELAAARAALLDGEGMETEALSELRFALGLEPRARVEIRGELYASDDPAPVAPAGSHPAIEVALARARAAGADAQLVSSLLGPSIGVGVQYVREGTGDQIALAVVSFPVPSFDAARFDAARQRANASTALAEAEYARAGIARDRALAEHDRAHWREVRAALQGALAATEEALRLARAQYEAGAHDVTIVLLARQRLAATRESLAHAAAEVQRADVRYGRAVGSLAYGRGAP